MRIINNRISWKGKMRTIAMLAIVMVSILCNKGINFAVNYVYSSTDWGRVSLMEDVIDGNKITYTRKIENVDFSKITNPGYDICLKVDENTILVVDKNLYFKGIRVKPGCTLKIQLKSGDLYTYGQRYHATDNTRIILRAWAGINVPEGATLIVEQIGDNAGKLVAVGACGTTGDLQGFGTGAGIGGNGYYFNAKDGDAGGSLEICGNSKYDDCDTSSNYSKPTDSDYNDSNCGTVIIRSGEVWACGGTDVYGNDGKGTGAGIGAGGIYLKDTDGNVTHNKVFSGGGGKVCIFGGSVHAIGGGTKHKSDTLYSTYQNILFNSGNGFSNAKQDNGNEKAKGTGAGIGGGGVYINDNSQVEMNTEFKFYYYGGQVTAVSGVAKNNTCIAGQGAAIGGGGLYTYSSTTKLINDNKKYLTTNGNVKINVYDRNCITRYGAAMNSNNRYYNNGYIFYDNLTHKMAETPQKTFENGVTKMGTTNFRVDEINVLKGACNEGIGVYIGYGAYDHNDDNEEDGYHSLGLIGTHVEPERTLTKYCSEWPTMAFTDYTPMNIEFNYAIASEAEENNPMIVYDNLYYTSIPNAISAAKRKAGDNASSYFSDDDKIYSGIGSGYKLFVRAYLDEKGGSNSYKTRTVVNSGLKSVKRSSYSDYLVTNSQILNDGQILQDSGNPIGNVSYKNNSGVEVFNIGTINGVQYPRSYDSSNYNDKYLSSCRVYFTLDLENPTTEKLTVTDMAGQETEVATTDTSQYVVPIEVNYGEEQIVPTGLPGICGVNNPTYDTNGSKYDYVYFGQTPAENYYTVNSPIKWRVLNRTGNDNSASLLMLSEFSLINGTASGDKKKDWSKSSLRRFLFGKVYKDCFTDKEKDTMHVTSKSESGNVTWQSGSSVLNAVAATLSNEKIFLLSAQEVINNSYGFNTSNFAQDINRKTTEGTVNGNKSEWWLRSPATLSFSSYVATISPNGEGFFRYDTSKGVRPALNIPLSHIICAFDASDDGSEKELATLTPPTNDTYRLTIYDSGRNSFHVGTDTITSQAGKTLKLVYSGATIGSGEYISIAITNDDGKKLYMGRYACTNESGEIAINLPADLGKGTYKMIVYNEHNNGKNKTNYAGFSVIKLNVEDTDVKIYYSAIGGDDDTKWHTKEGDILKDVDKVTKEYVKVVVNTAGMVTIDIGTQSYPFTSSAVREYPYNIDGLAIKVTGDITYTGTANITLIGALKYGKEQSVPTGLPEICGIKNPTYKEDGSKYDYVYFGQTPSSNYHNVNSPIKWRVLNRTGNDNSASLLMLSEFSLINESATGENKQIWSDSSIRTFLFDKVYTECFTDKEKDTMHITSKSESGNTSWKNGSLSANAGAAQLSYEKIFLLSSQEVINNSYGFNTSSSAKDINRATKEGGEGGNKSEWWLRSPVALSSDSYVATISLDGEGFWKYNESRGVRPALNIPLSHIICAFDASDDGSEKELATLTPPTNDTYRLTVYDGDRSSFNAGPSIITSQLGKTLTLVYNNATKGSNEYISVLITNADGQKLYMGRYACTNESGEMTINLPADLDKGTYKMIVYNEHNNGVNKTNYAGFSVVELNVEESNVEIYYSAIGGDDDTKWHTKEEDILNDVDEVTKEYVKVVVNTGSMVSINIGTQPYPFTSSAVREFFLNTEGIAIKVTGGVTYTSTVNVTLIGAAKAEPQGLPGWWDVGTSDVQITFGERNPSKSYPIKEQNGATTNYNNLFDTNEIEPMYWTIIDKKANDNSKTDALFVCVNEIAQRRFDASGNDWSTSELKTVLQNNIIKDCFSDREIKAMLSTTKTESQESNWYGDKKASPSNLSREKIFLLSANEMYEHNLLDNEQNWGDVKDENDKECYFTNPNMNYGEKWWLRSKIAGSNEVSIIEPYGYMSSKTACSSPSAEDVYVNAAMNIKASYIICAIDTNDDGTGTNGTYWNETTEDSEPVAYFDDIKYYNPYCYRLTIYDETRSEFKVNAATATAAPDGYIKLHYSGAQTGDNEYISAVIKELGKRATIKQESGSGDGTVTFQMPSDISEGEYTLIVYNEENNGIDHTNYGRHSIVNLTINNDAPPYSEPEDGDPGDTDPEDPVDPENPEDPENLGGATDDDLIEPSHTSSPAGGLTLTITVNSPTVGTVTIDNITETVTSISSLGLKDASDGFSKVNWDLNKGINWDAANSSDITRKLVYKDVGTTTSEKIAAILFDNTSNMDAISTINSKEKGKSYAVVTYGADTGTVAGKKGYALSGSSSVNSIKNSAKDYMYLVEAVGSTEDEKEVTLQKTDGGTTITDIPYVVNGNIRIASCTKSGNNVTVELEPTRLITGQHIKEVGVRAEYTQNDVTASRVKKTHEIDGKGGSFTFIFTNLPSSPTFTAYYINTDNEEISTVA